jgi:integrase
MKSRREFKVPLPTQAIEVLKTLQSLTFKDPESFLFPSIGKYGHMAENTLRLALHRLGFEVTVHGMRNLITNVLNEQGFNRDAIERQLDHQESRGHRNNARDMQNLREGMLHAVHRGECDTLGLVNNPD